MKRNKIEENNIYIYFRFSSDEITILSSFFFLHYLLFSGFFFFDFFYNDKGICTCLLPEFEVIFYLLSSKKEIYIYIQTIMMVKS